MRYSSTALLSSLLDCGENAGVVAILGSLLDCGENATVVALLSSFLECGENATVVVHAVVDTDPEEPANMSLLLAFVWTQAVPQSFCVKDVAS